MSRLSIGHNRTHTYQSNQRQIEIFRENQHLVRKIAAIHVGQKPPQPKIAEPFHRESMLCGRAAKQTYEKVMLENQRILCKILNVGPTVSKKKQEEDYKLNHSHIERIHKYRTNTYEVLYFPFEFK